MALMNNGVVNSTPCVLTAYALRYITGPHEGLYATRPALEAEERDMPGHTPALWTNRDRADYWLGRINRDVVGSVGTVELITFHCKEK